MAFERIIVHSRLHSAFSAFGGQLHIEARHDSAFHMHI